ncbi:glycosyltransferase family 4 protein [Streptodolium elevatio]|uniref:Glycosyltransferase family 4 protein n=1 Tax=Streptodolium elevatio TaxID=3157996 RepID=A0ABV3DM53_9ACTN
MRIAVVNNFYPPRLGGSAHFSASLARGYVEQGHQVVVLTATYGDAPSHEVVDGVEIYRLPARYLPQLGLAIDFDISFTMGRRNLKRVFRILDDFKPDVIHQHGQFLDLSWLSGWYARKRRIPVLLSIHTMLKSPKPLFHAIFRMLDGLVVRPTLSMYKPTLAVQDRIEADYCIERYKADLADMVKTVVPVSPEKFSGPPARDVRAELGLGDVPFIGSVGHVIPLRDRLLLVEAMPEVLAKFPDTKVVVVGRVYYDAFLKRAEELGIADAFICVGTVPQADVHSYLVAADIEVHDLSGQGAGTASLEAMASGTATIFAGTEDTYLDIPLKNWHNTLLVRPDDARGLAAMIVELLIDSEKRGQIAKRQQELVRGRFNLDRVVEDHLLAFERLARAKPTTSLTSR